MANRNARLITRNTITPNQPLSAATALKGEAIVNLYDGILYYSGAPNGTFVQSDNDITFFEVGSNVNQLIIRDKITSYSGETTGLEGKFLSGTSTGFVLAEINSIAGVDRHVTGFTYDETTNSFTITQTEGGPSKTVAFGEVSGLTINGNLTVTGNTNLNGTTLYDESVGGTNPLEIINLSYLTGYVQTSDVYVTGATYTAATNDTNYTSWSLLYHGNPIGGSYSFSGENTFVTGGTYSAGTITFNYNSSKPSFDVIGIDGTDTYVTGGTINTPPTTSNISGTTKLLYNDPSLTSYTIPYTDTFVTGFTYSDNTFTIKDNSGNTYSDTINSVTGLTVNGDLSVSGLGANRVVYTTGSGQLTTEVAFGYDPNTDKLSVTNAVIGSGGSISGSGTGDLIVHGNLTVFGQSISAFTSELYVEDNNIFLNYNPTGTTSASSIGAGITIQSGEGSGNGNASFELRALNTLTGNTGDPSPSVPYANDYPTDDGYSNRGWVTQLNDIVIRSSDITVPKGVRVLAEFDTLDGGSF